METQKLRVWWIPQVPGTPFYVSVGNLVESKLLLDTLAEYDKFQLDNNIKPDYSNAGGLQVFDSNEGDWLEWEDEIGDGIDDYTVEDCKEFKLKLEVSN